MKDYQGNNRMVMSQDGFVAQRTIYYPYGMPHADALGQDKQRFKYNGMEFDTMNGLNLHDYHARQQDPATGRFTTMDPLAEKYSISPMSE